MNTPLNEIGSETVEAHARFDIGRRLESLDDITREISDRRIHSEFGSWIDPEKSALLREIPDKIETDEHFDTSARAHGINDTEGLRGFATRPEDPAYVRRMEDVAQRIGTEGHEDLHRMTHPETLREASENPPLKEFYEGVTEYLNQQAMEGLHKYQPGEVYPEHVEAVRQLAGEVGDEAIRNWFFKHELSEELSHAIERLNQTTSIELP
jgi:hypothetical protein